MSKVQDEEIFIYLIFFSKYIAHLRKLFFTHRALHVLKISHSPPPVLEMPATFNLELTPGQHVALDVMVNSDELDMARMEDGTTVDGMFWGKLDIVHQGDTHKMEFSGTRLPPNEEYTPEFMFDSRVMTKLAVAAKPTTAKCHLTILSPAMQYCDVVLSFSPLWKLGITWPPAEGVGDNKVKYFLRVHAGGALEHFESELVSTALYYEAVYATFQFSFDLVITRRFNSPDPTMVDPNDYIAPRNGFAMSFRDFIPHLMMVLDQLGMSLHARTAFVKYVQHKLTWFSCSIGFIKQQHVRLLSAQKYSV